MSQAFLSQRSVWQYERYVPKCGFVQSPELQLEKADGEMDHPYDGDFLFIFQGLKQTYLCQTSKA